MLSARLWIYTLQLLKLFTGEPRVPDWEGVLCNGADHYIVTLSLIGPGIRARLSRVKKYSRCEALLWVASTRLPHDRSDSNE